MRKLMMTAAFTPAAIGAGDVDLTVFQDAAGQGRKGAEIIARMAKGEQLDERAVYIPFERVTPANADGGLDR